MSKNITIMMDNRIPIMVDDEEFEIIKIMVEESGAKDDLKKLRGVIEELVKQGYDKSHARTLCVLAR